MVDQDVQLEEGADRVQLLHYLQPNLFGSEILFYDESAPNATTATGAPYIAPNPPAGDIAHKYTFLMYRQPAGFEIPSEFASINPPATVNDRIGFDVDAFVRAAGLVDIIGATWFQVQNNATDDSSSSSGGSGSSSTTESSATTTTESDSGSQTSAAESSSTSAATTATTTGASSTGTGAGSTASATASATGTNDNAAGMVTASGSLSQMASAVILAAFGMWFL